MESTRDTSSESGGARNLDDLLRVQEQAIVSRVLLKNQGGTVTLFAFDAGEALSEHTAAFDALAFGIEGEAEIDVASATHEVRAGQVLELPASVPHAVRARSSFKMLLVMLRE